MGHVFCQGYCWKGKERGNLSEIVLALDTEDLASADRMLELLGSKLKFVKIGPRLFYLGGRNFVMSLKNRWNVLLDVKLHDIPNTVGGAVSALAEMGIFGLTLHVAGGEKMLREAVKRRDEVNPDMKIFGVTVLTSIDESEWGALAPGSTLEEAIKARTRLAERSGIDGVVCSPKDLTTVKEVSGKLLTLVPGVRPKGVSLDDQARIMTPAEAKKRGADFIVLGRPILAAPDSLEALTGIMNEVG